MIQWSNFDGRYLIVCGNECRYADTIGAAQEILAILEFGKKLRKSLDKFSR